MVYFFESRPTEYATPYQIVMGKDKFENDLLIKYSYKELNYVWFHTDKYSSAHVYLKLQPNEKSLDDVPDDVLNDCLQMVKANSIQANKMVQCTIIISPWTNLKKNRFMKPGEVSFKSLKMCRRKQAFQRDNKILNRLTKTRVELFEDVEETLHLAKKSKDGEFFSTLLANNRDKPLEEELERKRAKKLAKCKKKNQDDEGEDDI
ncbi:hypothetical protein KAFR_0A00370 [Kazachstania africana CBS 2517]|uniref:NFACT RNA-binding domain-containing protein n=1 Tax=Kazachstania africana (strain ATCC 22294 / BCRC 22015 / CBS 2517 / CECT 1963 / NBRC 1671 / NRRL Y-8276) TaxID=1071382 RepID=H2AM75_KAZAF|nr:hypothetical protein KAFR_0A00370 [Kazachstania africana CBS 2517]CCF55475.1 hypothetical protein KAFR_0A00370 [Kazachstania africana CBS 2517]